MPNSESSWRVTVIWMSRLKTTISGGHLRGNKSLPCPEFSAGLQSSAPYFSYKLFPGTLTTIFKSLLFDCNNVG